MKAKNINLWVRSFQVVVPEIPAAQKRLFGGRVSLACACPGLQARAYRGVHRRGHTASPSGRSEGVPTVWKYLPREVIP